jgi:transposase
VEIRKIISPTPHLPHLAVPKGTKPDRFYKEAAELYAELATQSRRPAADLAERSGVSVASVHRWIAEARRRGYLPPAERGRRG